MAHAGCLHAAAPICLRHTRLPAAFAPTSSSSRSSPTPARCVHNTTAHCPSHSRVTASSRGHTALAATSPTVNVQTILKQDELPEGWAWYETMLVLRPDLDDEARDQELAKFEAFLNQEKCQDITALVRGRQQLAYPIKGFWEGIYVLYTYGARRATSQGVQRLLSKPSIGTEPGNPDGFQKVFFGREEIGIPLQGSVADAVEAYPSADVFINFASFRSAYESTMEALQQPTIRVVAVIAEGVPEQDTKKLIAYARAHNKIILGPATVGGLQAGAFRIGDTAGTLDNIIACRLHRPGSVGFVSKSGGMSNEMYNVLSRTTDGLYEGIAIGGDVFPGSTLSDHCLRYQEIPQVKLIVVLGELGGQDEYSLVEALKEKRDLIAAQKAGKVRVPTNIVSTICDDRGEEPTYHGVDMTTLMTGDKNVGDVISLLWFKRQLPKYATRFIEMCIMLCADHGPVCQ
ncbi:hypothetical protein WJX84_006258, partial [Apatococcus fuscideae]